MYCWLNKLSGKSTIIISLPSLAFVYFNCYASIGMSMWIEGKYHKDYHRQWSVYFKVMPYKEWKVVK